jgi:ABC-type transporter Mla subunit MlaD
MCTTDSPRRRYRGLAAALSLAVALLLPAPTVMATDTSAAGTEHAEGELSEFSEPAVTATDLAVTEEAVAELRAVVDDLSARYDQLLTDNSSLQQTVADITSERDQLAKSLDRFDDLYGPLEADRQLLFELRKGLPETRPEAESQLARISTLALSSDPARLGQLVDRVGETAPAFLEWRFTEFGSTAEASQAYVNSGANAFDSTMNEFRNEVLMSVANRLDGILTIIDRIR